MTKSLIDLDQQLQPYRSVISRRERYIESRISHLLGDMTAAEFALGFHHFGLHRTTTGWVFREWVPSASKIVLVGDFSDWREEPAYTLQRGHHGQWHITIPADLLHHGDHYKLRVYWPGGSGWRLPSYTTYAVQDQHSLDFSAVVWQPATPYSWQAPVPDKPTVPLIYEAHVGMSSEAEQVASFDYFTNHILPRIARAGYNTVQLMALAEHPYYASFGYHVSNFFAVSSRFGTPDDLKRLVDTAHQLGLHVIIDLVHSHMVKNEAEGLGNFAGDQTQYCTPQIHPTWDSRLFNYAKPEVLHFLASNCRWWLDEYRVDGFRFDGVTSMLYTDHGLARSFTTYDDYFGDNIDRDAMAYLRLANTVIHQVRPDAVTIAEEMSGLPGVAAPIAHGGLGFDYRLQMGAPDVWATTVSQQPDDSSWDLAKIVNVLTSHRPGEPAISYVESHDQALVGDQTLLFRLIGQEMYDGMDKADPNMVVRRGVALHKLIRLLTAGLHQGGYLNFMGNEFGHPEWIDFPRAGNAWSYRYARRQWSLADNGFLQYQWLARFDHALMALLPSVPAAPINVVIRQADRVISFTRGTTVWIVNFSPHAFYTDYRIDVDAGIYRIQLSSDEQQFGGQGRTTTTQLRSTCSDDQHRHYIEISLPARTGIILQKIG